METRRGYAICTAPRSGSNWLCQLLASTDVLGRPLEYFNGPGFRISLDADYPLDGAAQIQRVLRDGSTPNGVYAVKTFPWLLDPLVREVRWADELPNLKYVHLERRDILGEALSLSTVNQTRQWRSTGVQLGTDAVYDGPGILESIRFIVRDEARWAVFFARNGIEPLRLVYENILLDPQAAVSAVAELMCVDAPQIDFERVHLKIQRADEREVWRSRFISEFADTNIIDDL